MIDFANKISRISLLLCTLIRFQGLIFEKEVKSMKKAKFIVLKNFTPQ